MLGKNCLTNRQIQDLAQFVICLLVEISYEGYIASPKSRVRIRLRLRVRVIGGGNGLGLGLL